MLVVDGLQGQSFGPVSFTLESGEIVGIAGAEGNGQPQLFDCLAGRQPPRAGRVVCDDRELMLISTHEAVRSGVMLLPGDRKHEALMPVLGVRVNSTIQSLRRFTGSGSSAGGRSVGRWRTWLPASRSEPRRSSSRSSSSRGEPAEGRRSRAPFLREPTVILAYEPTQGVDVGSRFDIYQALRTRTDAGAPPSWSSRATPSSSPACATGCSSCPAGTIIEEIPGDELNELRIVEAIVRGPGLSRAGRSPLGVAMPKAPAADPHRDDA